jgi:DUF2924 family protein
MSRADELAALESMSNGALRARWRATRNIDPPPKLSKWLLQSTLIYDLQAKRFGGLPQAAERKLVRIAAKLEKNPNASALEGEQPAPGAKLIREWGGVRHEVQILNEGFAYCGTIYGSLSEIARTITGAHWSGPRFFGLKNRRKIA